MPVGRRSEDDDGRLVTDRYPVELAAAGDQAEPGLIQVPVDIQRLEDALGHLPHRVDREMRDRAVDRSPTNSHFHKGPVPIHDSRALSLRVADTALAHEFGCRVVTYQGWW